MPPHADYQTTSPPPPLIAGVDGFYRRQGRTMESPLLEQRRYYGETRKTYDDGCARTCRRVDTFQRMPWCALAASAQATRKSFRRRFSTFLLFVRITAAER